MAASIRNMEIGLFWQRSNYFLVLNTTLAVGFFALSSFAYKALLGIMGVCVATLWVGVNLGSKFWQSRWEYRLHKTELDLGPELNLFSASWKTVQEDVVRSFEFRGRGRMHSMYKRAVLLKPSVTLMMTMLSTLFVAFWVGAIAICLLEGVRESVSWIVGRF